MELRNHAAGRGAGLTQRVNTDDKAIPQRTVRRVIVAYDIGLHAEASPAPAHVLGVGLVPLREFVADLSAAALLASDIDKEPRPSE